MRNALFVIFILLAGMQLIYSQVVKQPASYRDRYTFYGECKVEREDYINAFFTISAYFEDQYFNSKVLNMSNPDSLFLACDLTVSYDTASIKEVVLDSLIIYSDSQHVNYAIPKEPCKRTQKLERNICTNKKTQMNERYFYGYGFLNQPKKFICNFPLKPGEYQLQVKYHLTTTDDTQTVLQNTMPVQLKQAWRPQKLWKSQNNNLPK